MNLLSTLHRLSPMALAALLATSQASPVVLGDTELSSVHGTGIGIGVHLVLNAVPLNQTGLANVVATFNDNGVKTSLVVHGWGGVMDLFDLSLDLRQRPGGGDYIDLGLPQFAGFDNFGYRALSAQSDPTAPLSGNYGAMSLNGTLSMQGHVYLWAR